MLLVVIVWYFLQLVMVLTRQFDSFLWASQVVLVVKNHLRKQETKEMQVGSLGWEDPLEEAMATHSSIFAWRIPWTEEPGGGYSPWGHKRVGHA